jgi:hypothetical protein
MRVSRGKSSFIVCGMLVAAVVNANTPNQYHSAGTIDTKGTEANPIVVRELPQANPVIVKVLPTEKSPEQLAQEKRDRDDRRASDQETNNTNHMVLLIGLLQLFVFALQLAAFIYQGVKLNQTVKAAGEQSRDLKRSVDEANRAATAMEGMATAMKANVAEVTEAFALQKVAFKYQLRAFVSVGFRTCIEQDVSARRKFELQSDISNNGATPAIGANTASTMRVLPVPLPSDADLTLPIEDYEAAANLAPHRTVFIRTYPPTVLSDAEVAEIKSGTTKALYIYGTTRYKDVFGEPHFTNFCWAIAWDVGGQPYAVNVARHNDAN